jgi:hypothetical protein
VELQGKTPFVSDQILWCVFNDVGAPHSLSGGTSIGMEIQLTSWAFATPSGAPFSNTHKQEEASVVRLPPQLFIIHPTF